MAWMLDERRFNFSVKALASSIVRPGGGRKESIAFGYDKRDFLIVRFARHAFDDLPTETHADKKRVRFASLGQSAIIKTAALPQARAVRPERQAGNQIDRDFARQQRTAVKHWLAHAERADANRIQIANSEKRHLAVAIVANRSHGGSGDTHAARQQLPRQRINTSFFFRCQINRDRPATLQRPMKLRRISFKRRFFRGRRTKIGWQKQLPETRANRLRSRLALVLTAACARLAHGAAQC